MTMNLLTQNAKMKKTSKENKSKILNFSIPAYKTKSGKSTCPFAGGCQKYCYAQKGNYTRFPIVQELMEQKYLLSKQENFNTLMNEEIKKKKPTHVRIHDSGDFYSPLYLQKWIDISTDNKDVIFYAYNLKIIFSEGSKIDNLINVNKHRHARIFKDVTTLLSAGYIDASSNDLQAITSNKKVGLVFH